MKLHENKELFQDAVVATSQQKGIPEIYIEKDYWVTYALYMSLVRFSQTQDPIGDLRNKVRHTYDIHQMLKDKNLKTFFQSDEFETMLLRVAKDDIVSFKNNNKWLANHPATTILFTETTNTWEKIKDVYTGSFNELVFGKLPAETEILKTLIRVANRLKQVKWNITL